MTSRFTDLLVTVFTAGFFAGATLVRIAVLGVMLRHQFAECRHIAKRGKEAK